jgi:drug/metabolite transporter (DMT)-like permease
MMNKLNKGVDYGVSTRDLYSLLIIAGAAVGAIEIARNVAVQAGPVVCALLFVSCWIAFICILPFIKKRDEQSRKDIKINFLQSFLVVNPVIWVYVISCTTTTVGHAVFLSILITVVLLLAVISVLNMVSEGIISFHKVNTVSWVRKGELISAKTISVESCVNRSGIFAMLLIAGVTAGSIPTAGKIAMETGLSPMALLFFRYTIAFVFLLPIIVKRNEFSWNDMKNNFLPSFLSVMNPVVLFYALSYTTASVSILIYAAGPLFMALYHKFFCKTVLSKNQLVGLGVGFAGVAFILIQPIAKGGVGTVVGNLMVVIATLFFVSYTIFSGKQQAKKLVSPYSLVFYATIVAMMISVIPMFRGIGNVNLGLAQIGAIIWLGLVSTVVFFILFQFIVRREGTLVASVYAYVQATLGVIIGMVVLNEKITVLIVVGAILTFIGAKIVTQKVESTLRNNQRENATIHSDINSKCSLSQGVSEESV